MSEMWVADDGSYGMGDFDVIDTEKWTDAQWGEFEEAPDWKKIFVARDIMWSNDDLR